MQTLKKIVENECTRLVISETYKGKEIPQDSGPSYACCDVAYIDNFKDPD